MHPSVKADHDVRQTTNYASGIAKQIEKLYNAEASSQSPLTCAFASIRHVVTSG